MSELIETNWADLPRFCIEKIVRFAVDGHFNDETLGLLSGLDQKGLDQATKLQRVWASEWTRYVCIYGKGHKILVNGYSKITSFMFSNKFSRLQDLGRSSQLEETFDSIRFDKTR